MSRVSMAAAAALLPQAPIYGIAMFSNGRSQIDYELGHAELDRDTDWAHQILLDAGIVGGDMVLFTAGNHEAPWTTPIARALRRIGAPYITAETYKWDARRFVTFLQRLPIKAIIGLGMETVDALQDAVPSLTDLVAGVDIIWARADSLAQLKTLQINAIPFLPLGPALALGVPGEQGARINSAEWDVSSSEGRIHVSNLQTRLTRFTNLDTGISGSIDQTDGARTRVLPR